MESAWKESVVFRLITLAFRKVLIFLHNWSFYCNFLPLSLRCEN